MKLDKETREQLIERLGSPFANVKLKVDGIDVNYQARPFKPLQFCLVPFIDGTFEWRWTRRPEDQGEERDAKIARLFLRPRKRYVTAPSKLKKENRMRKRAGLAQISPERNTIQTRDLWFCPKALVRHLEKEAQSIEVIEDEREPAQA